MKFRFTYMQHIYIQYCAYFYACRIGLGLALISLCYIMDLFLVMQDLTVLYKGKMEMP